MPLHHRQYELGGGRKMLGGERECRCIIKYMSWEEERNENPLYYRL